MLAKYQYESGVNNGRLQKMTFGNDQTVQYSYDKFDRTTKEQYNNVTYEYAYDASGQLAKQTSTAGEEYNYEYDSLGRLIRSNEYNERHVRAAHGAYLRRFQSPDEAELV